MSEKKVGRRDLLKLLGTGAAGLVVGGLVGYGAAPAKVVQVSGAATTATQAQTVAPTLPASKGFEVAWLEETILGMTWPKLETAAKRGAIVLVPVGPVEAHGTHLPVATDLLVTTATCVLVKKNLADVGVEAVIGPPYYCTADAGGYHEEPPTPPSITMLFPGTISTSPSRMSQNILDVIACMGDDGFRKFFILNNHGGLGQQEGIYGAVKAASEGKVKNPQTGALFTPPLEVYWVDPISPVGDVTSGLRTKYGLTLKEPFWLNWRDLIPASATSSLKSSPPRTHAEEIETSADMYFYPDLVDWDAWRRLPPGTRWLDPQSIAEAGALIAKGDLEGAKKIAPEMIIGDATVASAETGKNYWELTGQLIAQAIQERLQGKR